MPNDRGGVPGISSWFTHELLCRAAMVFSGFFIVLTMTVADPGKVFAANAKRLSPTEMDRLLAPVALYPDPLLAQVLPAATVPEQVTQAAQWLELHPDRAGLDQQPWEPCVVGVVQYPTVLKKMYRDYAWTVRLGNAFSVQEADTLKSVQRLRKKAQLMGNLSSSSQQKVIVTGTTIQILPAEPTIIYVPEYNPTIVYTQRPLNPAAPLIAFAAGIALGSASNNSSSTTVVYYPATVNWHSGAVVYHAPPASGWATAYHGVGPRGYGSAYRAGGTGIYGNDWNAAAVHGRTWNGGAYQGTARSRELENGGTVGSYQASAVGPHGTARSSGWGYENDDVKAGAVSHSGTTKRGAYNISGSGIKTDDGSSGSITASGINRQGEYKSKTWTKTDGSWSSTSSRSGNIFSGAHTGTASANYASRGHASRSAGFGGHRRR